MTRIPRPRPIRRIPRGNNDNGSNVDDDDDPCLLALQKTSLLFPSGSAKISYVLLFLFFFKDRTG
ncbi:hypothetical protein AMATHDRAFT_71574 [Amanita thiersii Skay4041]|uniref:Uncharacterized protein n=1 Tax=Amanita thiersii Skay4041 TaxID=703135 RepID=A0A2A9NBC4_9AGAR|nr:hypothetical protein AMATHDRAFT_71574 [Amanita thiersii Skay4041]